MSQIPSSEILQELQSLLIGRWMTDLANTSALLFQHLPGINWVGFYLLEGNNLALGPFQGKPACTDISLGKGVCGSAAMKQITIVVPDVHQFEGHIACDPNSRSEIVVPMVRGGQVLGVLDVDAPSLARFGKEEQKFLESVVEILLSKQP